MADLIVTFTRADLHGQSQTFLPVALGSAARTELLAIGGASVASDTAAVAGEYAVVVKAGADCWIAIGPAPVAIVGAGHDVSEGERREFVIEVGDAVAVIAA